jgi:ribosomal-protein-alanine N-acetyltransferase
LTTNPGLEKRVSSLHTRTANAADIPAMMALERGAANAAHWLEHEYQRLFESSLPHRVAIVIEEHGEVQGFLIARALDREWEIENIVVSGALQRRGLGTALLSGFLKSACAEGAEEVFLEVRESNTAARKLYEKLAFREGGRRKNYYRQPDEDAVIYRLKLL